MSVARTSLNAAIPIHPLLAVLGCRVRLQGLPFSTQCPLCRGVLTVYRDYACGGGWHHCADCGSQGDLIALAAAARQQSVPDTLAYLAFEGIPVPTDSTSIQRYIDEHVEYPRRLSRLWDEARGHRRVGQFSFSGGAPKIDRRLDDGAVAEGPAEPLLGLTNVTAVEQCFSPADMTAALARGHKTNTSGHRTFVGTDWGQVQALAYYDLPGRICGFLFMGRKMNPDSDFVIKRANRGVVGNQFVEVDAEGGLAFHASLPRTIAAGQTIVGVADPLIMVKLQSRRLSHHLPPLPLVSYLDTAQFPKWNDHGRRTRTQGAWQMFSGCKIVVWAPAGLNVFALRQAIATEGWISTAGPEVPRPGGLDKYIAGGNPRNIIDRVVRTAVPWAEALSQRLERGRAAELRRWLIQLEHEQEPVDLILARCSDEARARVATLRETIDVPRTIDLDGRIILEAHKSWLRTRNGHPPVLILNAVLRIDQILISRENGVEQAIGRIFTGNRVIPFVEPWSNLESDIAEFLNRVVLRENAGLLQLNKSYARHLLRIAISFQEPERVEAITRTGWDRRSDRFVFPHFQIASDRTVSPVSSAFLPEVSPGANLVFPTDANPLTAGMLRFAKVDAEVVRVFWATLACIITNLVSPRFDLPPNGICLEGRGAQMIGLAVAKAVGCLHFPVHLARDVKHARLAEQAHGVPLTCEIAERLRLQSRKRFFDHDEMGRNCIVPVDWPGARLLAIAGGWHVVHNTRSLVVSEDLFQPATLILPAFLKYQLERDSGPGDDGPPIPVSQTLWHLAEFVRSHNVDADDVYAAAGHLLPDCQESAHNAFVDLLGRLVSERRLAVGRQPDRRRNGTLIAVPEQDVLLLRHETLASLVHKVPVKLSPPHRTAERIGIHLADGRRTDTYALPLSSTFARWGKDYVSQWLPSIVRTGPTRSHDQRRSADTAGGGALAMSQSICVAESQSRPD